MKRQLSLKWNLTLSMTGIWVIIICILSILFNSIVSKTDQQYFDLLKREVSTESIATATDIAFEAAAKDLSGLTGKLEAHAKKHPETMGIGVVDTNRNILSKSKEDAELEKYLIVGSGTPHGGTYVTDDVIIGAAVIDPEGGTDVGIVIIVKSIKAYKKQKTAGFVMLLIAGFIGIVLVTASAYFLGSRLLRPINSLVEASENIADGNLEKIEIGAIQFHELNRLGTSVKRMAEAMQSQVIAIKMLISKISNISKETEGTMANLASSATQQAAAVNETAATVEEMEKGGQSSAINAKHIVAAAEKTSEASNRGKQTIEKTYEIIMQIKDESLNISEKSKNLLNAVEEVGNIIQSVNSIAEQSKILAVNASIEAAKAGEFGSGFAVVAQEVKDLAQQSKDATLQITGTLTAIRAAIETMVSTAQQGKERTEEGVNTIANAGFVMNDLSEAIRENSDFAKLIATNIQQQTIGLAQIAAAIEEINTTALENQSISRSIVGGNKQLSQTLAQLSEMVDMWRTPDNT